MRVTLLLVPLFCLFYTSPSIMSSAGALEIEPPPLAWEPRPEKKEVDNTEYWRRKYGKKEEKVETPPQKEESGEASAGKSDEEPSAEVPNSVEGGRIGNTDNSGAGLSKLAEPKKGEDVPDQVFLKPKKCNFSTVIGKNIKTIDFSLFKDRPVRVIYPGMPVTQDYSVDRVNLSVQKNGTIVGVSCN